MGKVEEGGVGGWCINELPHWLTPTLVTPLGPSICVIIIIIIISIIFSIIIIMDKSHVHDEKLK